MGVWIAFSDMIHTPFLKQKIYLTAFIFHTPAVGILLSWYHIFRGITIGKTKNSARIVPGRHNAIDRLLLQRLLQHRQIVPHDAEIIHALRHSAGVDGLEGIHGLS